MLGRGEERLGKDGGGARKDLFWSLGQRKQSGGR